MKPKTSQLFSRTLAAGALGLCLRLALYRFGFDEKNILSSSHPLHLACLVLTVGVALCLALAVRKLACGTGEDFPNSLPRSAGALAAACGMLVHGLSLTPDSSLSLARTVLAFGCALSMAICVIPGPRFHRLRTVCHGIICGFFALDMLCRYQAWSGNPQLPDYFFQVFACVTLALSSYHRLAFGTGLGKRRALVWCSLMGLYLCLVCAGGPETQPFYLGGACWAGVCMCTIQPPEEEEQTDVPA